MNRDREPGTLETGQGQVAAEDWPSVRELGQSGDFRKNWVDLNACRWENNIRTSGARNETRKGNVAPIGVDHVP